MLSFNDQCSSALINPWLLLVVAISSAMVRAACTLSHQALLCAGRTQKRLLGGSERRRFTRLPPELKDSSIWIRISLFQFEMGNCCLPFWTWKFSFKTGPEFMMLLASKISGFRKTRRTQKNPFWRAVSKICGFGQRIYWFRMVGGPIRIKRYAVSKVSGFM